MDPSNIPDRRPRDPDDLPEAKFECPSPCPPFCSALLGGCEGVDDSGGEDAEHE